MQGSLCVGCCCLHAGQGWVCCLQPRGAEAGSGVIGCEGHPKHHARRAPDHPLQPPACAELSVSFGGWVLFSVGGVGKAAVLCRALQSHDFQHRAVPPGESAHSNHPLFASLAGPLSFSLAGPLSIASWQEPLTAT